jgi:hypothetical protein
MERIGAIPKFDVDPLDASCNFRVQRRFGEFGNPLSMKASSAVGSISLAELVGVFTILLAGCASCKPGKPGKPKAYHVTVNLDESLKQGSVLVDLVAANPASLPRWEAYSMGKYWKDGDPMRNDADKVTLSFVTGQSLTNELGRMDAKWNKWLAQGATHLVVLADLPGARQDKAGTQDERRQVVTLDPCNWPDKTTNLLIQVQRSGINILTPPRPVK